MSIAHHVYTAVDCAHPASLARFYAGITGWEVGELDDSEDKVEWVEVFQLPLMRKYFSLRRRVHF